MADKLLRDILWLDDSSSRVNAALREKLSHRSPREWDRKPEVGVGKGKREAQASCGLINAKPLGHKVE